MCGRTACTLGPDEICKACSTQRPTSDGKKQYQSPQWQDHPGNFTYSASCNMAPSRFTPVMISEHHVRGTKREVEGEGLPPQYVIQPMMWGLIPPFYKGSNRNGHGFSTTNCRLEDIENKRTFKPSLTKGQRCVVLCEGFYEWQTTKGDKNKQPYFIYAPQPEGVEIWNRESWDKPDVWSEEEGWKGPRLLKMAGLFSSWVSTEGEKVMSYSVLTMESGKKFSSLHHRVPAILETDQDVEKWLNFGDINYKEALAMLTNEVEVEWHPVSTNVNNSRNQEPNLNAPISLDKKPPETASSKLMSAWLSKGSVKKESPSSKPVKKESLESIKNENVPSSLDSCVTPVKKESLESVKNENKPSSLDKWLKKESDSSATEK